MLLQTCVVLCVRRVGTYIHVQRQLKDGARRAGRSWGRGAAEKRWRGGERGSEGEGHICPNCYARTFII